MAITSDLYTGRKSCRLGIIGAVVDRGAQSDLFYGALFAEFWNGRDLLAEYPPKRYFLVVVFLKFAPEREKRGKSTI
jgi:hypothetical protein